MKRAKAAVALLISVLVPASTGIAQSTDCASVLREAFNTAVRTQSAQSSSSYKAWQCSSDFSSHDDAIKSGLDVGAVIYGVPVKVGGTFDRNQVSTWKSANCSSDQRTASSANATYEFVRTITPEAAALVAKCFPSGEALACGLTTTGNTAVFTAAWQRQNGAPANAAPKVQSMSVVGGSCQSKFRSGDRLVEGGTARICSISPEQDFVIALSTSSGSCFETASGKTTPQVITGKLILTRNTSFESPFVEIRSDAHIITNGYQLTIVADRELKIDGNPSIEAFTDADSAAGRGLHGRPANAVILQSPRLTGDQLTIRNFGEDGQKGATGPQGRQGAAGAGNFWGNHGGLKFGCGGSRTSGDGDVGGIGQTGGIGGSAGAILLKIGSGLQQGAASRILIETTKLMPDGTTRQCNGSCGGAPGKGGDGGSGGPPGNTGAGTGGCGGGGSGNPGPTGPTGSDGVSGSDIEPTRT